MLFQFKLVTNILYCVGGVKKTIQLKDKPLFSFSPAPFAGSASALLASQHQLKACPPESREKMKTEDKRSFFKLHKKG